MVSFEEHPGSWELTGRFPGTVSLIRGMSSLCQGAGGVPGTEALIPRNAVPCTFNSFFLPDSFFFEWAGESGPTTAKFGVSDSKTKANTE